MPSATTQTRIINWIHVIQIPLVSAILLIGTLRMFGAIPNVPKSSSGRWGVSVAGKSLMVLQYEILTENFKWFHRWYSIKAFLILNIIEVGFWIAAVVLTAMSMARFCDGTGCILSGVTVGMASVLGLLATPVAVFTIKQYMFYRQNGYHPNERHFTRKDEGLQQEAAMVYLTDYSTKV